MFCGVVNEEWPWNGNKMLPDIKIWTKIINIEAGKAIAHDLWPFTFDFNASWEAGLDEETPKGGTVKLTARLPIGTLDFICQERR